MLKKIVTALALAVALGGSATGVELLVGPPDTQVGMASGCIGVGCGPG